VKGFSLFFSWIQAIITDLFALLLVIGLRCFSFFHTPKEKIERGLPILLVHGYCNTSSVWAYIKWKLTRLKIGSVFILDLEHPFDSIQKHAKTLAQKVEQIEKETGSKKIILIGHSMGGLVSALYATKIAPAHKVTALITIGSPLAGTHLAKFGLGENAREMEIDSLFLQEMQKLIHLNKTVQFYHIASKTDTIVLPYTSSWIGGKLHKKRIFSGIGHVGLLYSPRVCSQLLDWIRSL